MNCSVCKCPHPDDHGGGPYRVSQRVTRQDIGTWRISVTPMNVSRELNVDVISKYTKRMDPEMVVVVTMDG